MPGPTYHFGGHSLGNLASMASKNRASNPKEAALEWLNKVSLVQSLGATQLILPPHRRPLKIHNKEPTQQQLSSGFIWMANAGHFFPNPNNQHLFIPSNMNQTSHRHHEGRFNHYWIKKIVKNGIATRPIQSDDEGAANSIWLWGNDMSQGLSVFIVGKTSTKYPIRQNKSSAQELISKSKLTKTFILEQHPNAIDAGVFHNDVISFGFKNYLFCHKQAFVDQKNQLNKLSQVFQKTYNIPLHIIEVTNKLTINEAINTYLFNSQVIIKNNQTYLLCPELVNHCSKSKGLVSNWKSTGIFDDILFVKLSNSLMNGGGPACLRLTLYLHQHDIAQIPEQFFLTPTLIEQLKTIINTSYPSKFESKNMSIYTKKMRNIVKNIESMFMHHPKLSKRIEVGI